LQERIHLGDLGVDGRIILKWGFGKIRSLNGFQTPHDRDK